MDQATASVKSIMTASVVQAKLHWTVKELAHFFSENHVTGAPVCDINGQLVGVVTVTDLLKVTGYDQSESEMAKVQAYYEEFLGQAFSEHQTQQLMDVAQSSFGVKDIMSAQVLSVEVDCQIAEVARLMVKEKVHRVFVTEDEQLVGVVSTMDVLTLLIDGD
jgi:predicted transcriptional regulator